MNNASGEPWRQRAVPRLGSTQWAHRVGAALRPSFCFPHPTRLLKTSTVSASSLLERRRAFNDVSILPPSLHPGHYNKAASNSSSPNLAEFPLSGEGPGRLGILFLEGHHTLVLGQDEAAALVCLLCVGLGKKLIPSHKIFKTEQLLTVENGGQICLKVW